MAKDDSLSAEDDSLRAEHLRWLIEGRDRNQRANAKLLALLRAYAKELGAEDAYLTGSEHRLLVRIAHPLVGVCFSLWRAVFLGDVDQAEGNVHGAAIKFLGEVILNNTITYP